MQCFLFDSLIMRIGINNRDSAYYISEGMKFEQINKLDEEEFRRLTGVKKTFEKVIQILIEEETKKKAKGGKPNKQCMKDRLLMALASFYLI